MLDDDLPLEMTDAEFRLFADLIRARCGLHYDADTRFLAERRIARRLRDADIGSFSAYLYELRHGANAEDEFSQLVDLLTTNETYFFRERTQLEALVQEIIPERLACARDAARPVSIWSAGCSSGEEPYSIVMLALEAGLRPGRDLRVYASDISRTVLAKARRGVYREASFRETEPRFRKRYFVQNEGLLRISDDVKRHVDFVQMNLVDPTRYGLLGPMDVILCRNVIIYFDLETKKRVMASFHDQLAPSGFLLLGHSESLINVTADFELKHLTRELVYRRPVPGEERSDPWHRIAARALGDETAGDRGGRDGSERD